MGQKDNFIRDLSSAVDISAKGESSETVNYITDLLGELQTIANISGLSRLSDDINAVMSKHMAG